MWKVSFLERYGTTTTTKRTQPKEGAVINLSFLIVWCKISLFPSINHFLLPEPVHNIEKEWKYEKFKRKFIVL